MSIAQPSISISCSGQVDQSSAQITSLNYKRAIYSIGNIYDGAVNISPVYYYRAIYANGLVEQQPAQLNPVTARSIVATGYIDQSVAYAIPTYKRAISALGVINDPVHSFKPGYIRAVKTSGLIDNASAECEPTVAHAMQANGQIDQASTSITRLYREFLPPPAQGVLNLIKSDQQIRLFGASLYAGDGYRVAVIVRGYNLTFLSLNYGPHLLFTVKGSASDPDTTAIFRKSTILPWSGISIQNVRDVETNANGTLQELTAQLRLYPEDTKDIGLPVLYYELELVDPLSERVTLEVGSFQLVGGVRGGR